MSVSPVVVLGEPMRLPEERKRPQRRPSPAIYRRSADLNRSRKWQYAESYDDARRISPCPHVPVR
jgi:hypothetical protein